MPRCFSNIGNKNSIANKNFQAFLKKIRKDWKPSYSCLVERVSPNMKTYIWTCSFMPLQSCSYTKVGRVTQTLSEATCFWKTEKKKGGGHELKKENHLSNLICNQFSYLVLTTQIWRSMKMQTFSPLPSSHMKQGYCALFLVNGCCDSSSAFIFKLANLVDKVFVLLGQNLKLH